jgi:hypothetical protein
MPADRLPASTQLLLSELLDLEVGAAAAAAVPLPVKGSFVTKAVKGRTYWYLQRVEGARTRQHYLGPDSVELRRWVEKASAARADRVPDDAVRRRLCAMLAAGGALTEPAAVLRVVELLADAGVFRLGGVLVGTFGFRVLGNLLGVRLAGAHLRTDDVDIAQEPGMAIAIDPTVMPRDVPAAFGRTDPPLLPVPGLDPRSPSTTFRARGRELRVDFLTPGPWRGNGEPVPLPAFGCAAQPLPFLGYLIHGAIPAVVLGPCSVFVNVPQPARFALHKLFSAGIRPPTFHTKATKDLRQAGVLLEVLAEERPGELVEAWKELDRHRRARAKVLASMDRLEPALKDRLRQLLPHPEASR